MTHQLQGSGPQPFAASPTEFPPGGRAGSLRRRPFYSLAVAASLVLGALAPAALVAMPAAAAASTPVALAEPVSVATYVGAPPSLPAEVAVKTEDGSTRMAPAVWDLEGYSFGAAYRTFIVTGTVEGSLTVTAQVEVVPQGIKYFVDSGMNASTPPFAGVKRLVGEELLNSAADQQYASGAWGYVNDGDTYVGQRAGAAAEKDETGLYAKGNGATSKPIIYNVPLSEGTYTVTAGFREWWSGPRQMKVSVVSASGQATVITPNVTVTSSDRSKMVSNQFTLGPADAGTVQVRVDIAGGTEAPVIGWFGIASGTVSIDTAPIVVDAPTVSVPAGTYKTAQSVDLNTNTADASIYYTTDGTAPSRANGTKYSGPVQIENSATLKAIAFRDGIASSAIEASYVIEPVPDSYESIPVGRTWYDTSDNPIQAHGGGFLEKDGWYYWVGENKSHNSASFLGVSLYKSQDLKNWTYVKDILTPQSDPALVNAKVERPKLVFNEKTGTYVLWGHWETADSYAASHLMVATSTSVDGDYAFDRHFRPGAGSVGTPEEDPTYTGGDGKWGYGSRDFTVFKDPDSADAYLISAEDHMTMRMYKLTPDYADVDWQNSYEVFEGQRREAPALVKAGDYYYAFTSSQSGWYPNQTMYSSTKNISDPHGWSELTPVGNNTTFYSQPTNIMTIQGEDGHREYVYMGDRWNSKALGSSTYVWLPLAFNAVEGDKAPEAAMNYQPSWSFDATTGSVSVPSDRLVSQGKPVTAAGTNPSFPATAANDGNLFNLNVSGDNSNYYQPPGVPYTWEVDLEQEQDLSRIDLSFRSYNGSETYSQYTVEASNDRSTWTRLVSEGGNKVVGFKSNPLSGQYRYVRVSVTNVVNDHNGSAAAWAAGLVEVQVYSHPAPQAISFDTLEGRTFGSEDFTLTASSTSGLPVSFTAAGQCTVAASTVHITGAGECSITAEQRGNESFSAAPAVTQSFVIAKAAQSITFDALADQMTGSPDIPLLASGTSGLPVTFQASGSCTVTGDSAHPGSPGTCTITAAQAGNENYLAAPDITRAFSVTYGVAVTTDLSKPVRSGSVLTLKLHLTDAAGANLSSSAITVQAISLDGAQTVPSPGNSQPGQKFTFDPATSTYRYNLSTNGLKPGTHTLQYTAGTDPTTHTTTFTIR